MEESPNIQKVENFSKVQLTEESKHYLLLEGGLNDELYDEVSAVEFKTFKHWIYEDTEFDEEKEHGPLLVELDEENKLLKYFSDTLIKQHMGVIITTGVKSDQLIQHILNLRYVTLPEDESNDPQQKIMFRWYEPRQLFGLLNAFNDKELIYFMGIIDEIIWCEWAFNQGHWYQATNKKSKDDQSLDKENIAPRPPIAISENTIKSMGQHDEKYFVRELSREIMHDHFKDKKDISEEDLKQSVLKQVHLSKKENVKNRDQIKALLLHRLKKD